MEILSINEIQGKLLGKAYMFYFHDSHFKLNQFCLGITQMDTFKRLAVMNDVCYEQALARLKKGHQVFFLCG